MRDLHGAARARAGGRASVACGKAGQSRRAELWTAPVPAACLGVQAGASFVLAALEPPAWTVVILGVVLLTADALLLLVFAYGRDHAHDVEEEHGTGEA